MLVGGVYALWLREIPFSVSAAVGFVALSGIADLNDHSRPSSSAASSPPPEILREIPFECWIVEEGWRIEVLHQLEVQEYQLSVAMPEEIPVGMRYFRNNDVFVSEPIPRPGTNASRQKSSYDPSQRVGLVTPWKPQLVIFAEVVRLAYTPIDADVQTPWLDSSLDPIAKLYRAEIEISSTRPELATQIVFAVAGAGYVRGKYVAGQFQPVGTHMLPTRFRFDCYPNPSERIAPRGLLILLILAPVVVVGARSMKKRRGMGALGTNAR